MLKNFTKRFSACLTAAAVFATMITASVFAADADGTDWEKGVIRATGLAAGNPNTKNKGLQRAQARRAARMDAQRNLAESVAGVQVTSESSMEDLMLKYDEVRTRVEANIKGMREVSEKYYDDDTCEVVLEMPMFGASNALSTAAFIPYKDEPREPFPQPSTTVSVNVKANFGGDVKGISTGSYTGLVVDCSGMDLNPVMSPVIKNNGGQSIYGHRNLDIDKVIEFGMASYAEASNDAISRDRAGDNPLVVKAVALEGFNANPVVSVNDSDRILIANQNDQFLDDLKVVFVK